jgi:hypothetical protein
MINIFFTEGKTIKNNVLFVETTQIKKEISVNLRTVRMRIKEMQVFNDSSDKK